MTSPQPGGSDLPLRLLGACSSAQVHYNVTVVTFQMASAWLLLLYKISPEPTSRRVYIWRKLKRLGAILLHDAAWVLPDTARTREQFQWLAAEIGEMGGEALLWESRLVLNGPEETLIQQFVEQADAAYHAILKELEKDDPNLAVLSQQYQQAKLEDYFHSPLGEQARQALVSARGGRDE